MPFSDINSLYMEIPGSLLKPMTRRQCAIKAQESSMNPDLSQRATAFKFINETCTLGKTPEFHDAFWNKTTNDESAVHVAINTKPICNEIFE